MSIYKYNSIILLLYFLIHLYLSLSFAINNNVEIILNKNLFFQGDTIFIYLTGNNNITYAHCVFNNRKYKFYRIAEDKHRAIIGLPADIPPDKYRLEIKYKVRQRQSKWYIKKEIIEVKERVVAIQQLKLSKRKIRLYHHKNVQHEYKKIFDALKKENPQQLWTSEFIMPIENGKITTHYGVRRMINNKLTKSYHKGIDIAPRNSNYIKAAQTGIVVLCADLLMHGKTIIINHGQGIFTLYLHMQEILVKEGDKVNCGDIIGIVGSTGVATGVHLHFGLYVHKVPVDPLNWINQVTNF